MWRQPRNYGIVASHSKNAIIVYRMQSRQLGTRRNVPPKLPATRKDKIRRLEKILPDASLISKQLMNRAESRITTAHNYVMSFWNAERYQQQPAEDGSPPPRPPRVGPNMDRRWWFWNTAFALFPAVFITLWAELYGKPKMKAAYIKAEVQKRKLIYGPNYVPSEGEIKYPEDNDPILDRVQRGFQDLSLWFLGTSLFPKRDEPTPDGTPPAQTPPVEAEKQPLVLLMASRQRLLQPADIPLATAQPQPTVEAQRQAAPESSKQEPARDTQPPPAKSKEQPTPDPNQQPTSEESEKLVTKKGDKDVDWRWNELFSRITNIENRLSQQEQRQQNMHDFQWHRLNQSNIQNRGEDQLIKHWESQRQTREPPNNVSPTEKSIPFWVKQPTQKVSDESGGPPVQDVENPSMYSKWKTAMWTGLRHLDAKKEAMEKYGVDIMDRAWGFWDGKSEENDRSEKPTPREAMVVEVTADPEDTSSSQPEAARSYSQHSESRSSPTSTTSSASSLTDVVLATNASPDKMSTEVLDASTGDVDSNISPSKGLWHRLLGRPS